MLNHNIVTAHDEFAVREVLAKNQSRNWKMHHIRQIWWRAALVIAHFKDQFERPGVFRPCSIHEHAKTVLKNIPEKGVQQYFEQCRIGCTIAEQVNDF